MTSRDGMWMPSVADEECTEWMVLAVALAALERMSAPTTMTMTKATGGQFPGAEAFYGYIHGCLKSPGSPIAMSVKAARAVARFVPGVQSTLKSRDDILRRVLRDACDATCLATLRLTSDDLDWALHAVESRANNFSFEGSSDELRPYANGANPLGSHPTLCPVFDLMNHVGPGNTNVIVADGLVKGGGTSTGVPTAGAVIGSLPSIVIGVLVPIAAGKEIGYEYNVPRRQEQGHLQIDVAACLTRWGFTPN